MKPHHTDAKVVYCYNYMIMDDGKKWDPRPIKPEYEKYVRDDANMIELVDIDEEETKN